MSDDGREPEEQKPSSTPSDTTHRSSSPSADELRANGGPGSDREQDAAEAGPHDDHEDGTDEGGGAGVRQDAKARPGESHLRRAEGRRPSAEGATTMDSTPVIAEGLDEAGRDRSGHPLPPPPRQRAEGGEDLDDHSERPTGARAPEHKKGARAAETKTQLHSPPLPPRQRAAGGEGLEDHSKRTASARAPERQKGAQAAETKTRLHDAEGHHGRHSARSPSLLGQDTGDHVPPIKRSSAHAKDQRALSNAAFQDNIKNDPTRLAAEETVEQQMADAVRHTYARAPGRPRQARPPTTYDHGFAEPELVTLSRGLDLQRGVVEMEDPEDDPTAGYDHGRCDRCHEQFCIIETPGSTPLLTDSENERLTFCWECRLKLVVNAQCMADQDEEKFMADRDEGSPPTELFRPLPEPADDGGEPGQAPAAEDEGYGTEEGNWETGESDSDERQDEDLRATSQPKKRRERELIPKPIKTFKPAKDDSSDEDEEGSPTSRREYDQEGNPSGARLLLQPEHPLASRGPAKTRPGLGGGATGKHNAMKSDDRQAGCAETAGGTVRLRHHREDDDDSAAGEGAFEQTPSTVRLRKGSQAWQKQQENLDRTRAYHNAKTRRDGGQEAHEGKRELPAEGTGPPAAAGPGAPEPPSAAGGSKEARSKGATAPPGRTEYYEEDENGELPLHTYEEHGSDGPSSRVGDHGPNTSEEDMALLLGREDIQEYLNQQIRVKMDHMRGICDESQMLAMQAQEELRVHKRTTTEAQRMNAKLVERTRMQHEAQVQGLKRMRHGSEYRIEDTTLGETGRQREFFSSPGGTAPTAAQSWEGGEQDGDDSPVRDREASEEGSQIVIASRGRQPPGDGGRDGRGDRPRRTVVQTGRDDANLLRDEDEDPEGGDEPEEMAGASPAMRRSKGRELDAKEAAKVARVMRRFDKLMKLLRNAEDRELNLEELLLEMQGRDEPEPEGGQDETMDQKISRMSGNEDEDSIAKKLDTASKLKRTVPKKRSIVIQEHYGIDTNVTSTSSRTTVENVGAGDLLPPKDDAMVGTASVDVVIRLQEFLDRVFTMFGLQLHLVMPIVMCISHSKAGFNVVSSTDVARGKSWTMGSTQESVRISRDTRRQYAAQSKRLYNLLLRFAPKTVVFARALRAFGGDQRSEFVVGAPAQDCDGVKVLHAIFAHHRRHHDEKVQELEDAYRDAYTLVTTLGVSKAILKFLEMEHRAREVGVAVPYKTFIQPLARLMCTNARYALELQRWMKYKTCETECNYDDTVYLGTSTFLREMRDVADNGGADVAIVSTQSASVASACLTKVNNALGTGGGGGGRGGRDLATVACYTCGQLGHLSRNCPTKNASASAASPDAEAAAAGPGGGRAGGFARVKCFNCQATGHYSKDCPKPKNNGCWNCGELGHQSKDCSKKKDGAKGAKAAAASPSGPSGADSNVTCIACNKNKVAKALVDNAVKMGKNAPQFCYDCFKKLRHDGKLTGANGHEHVWHASGGAFAGRRAAPAAASANAATTNDDEEQLDELSRHMDAVEAAGGTLWERT